MVTGTITTIDGCRIAWRSDGAKDAPLLLLSNSLGTSMAMWEPQMAIWTRHCRILRYDTRGHGRSGAPAGAYSIDRLGRDVIELLDQLDISRAHVCGLSLGGMIGQWLAAHAPERVSRLVLANTSAYMGPPQNWQARIDHVLAHGMAPLAEAAIARWFTPAFATTAHEAIAPIREMLLATDPIGYVGCCAAIRDMDQRPTAPLNRLPTLVIAGEKDQATSVDDGAFLASQTENGRLVILPAAHLSNVELPDRFASHVLDFVHGRPADVR